MGLGLLLLAAIACRKEDDITPEAPAPNPFYPDASATDEHAQLCRDFYTATGCYLLLNDTLKHEYIGTDRYGEPLYSTELLDLTYGITSSVQWKFEFTLSTDYQDQIRAVEILKKDILKSMDKRYHPYAILLVKNFVHYAYRIEEGETTGVWSQASTNLTYYIGERAMLIATDGLLQNLGTLKNGLMRDLLDKQLTENVLKEFYAPGNAYYGKNEVYGFANEDDFLNRTGILDYESDEYEEGWAFWISSKTADLKAYLNPLLDGEEEEFMAAHATHSAVLTKFKLLKEIVLDLGFNIY